MLKKALKPFLIVTSILALLIVRFILLNNFPVGVLHDEIDVVMSAKTYWLFGKDLSGVEFPKSMFVTDTWAYLSGLPSYLLSPVYGLVNTFTPEIIRLPFVVLSLITIYYIYLILVEFTKDKKIWPYVLIISLVNPWLFFYSRQPTEAPFSLLFALMAIYYFLKYDGLRSLIISIPLFLAAFFSYFGAKPSIPVLMILIAMVSAYKEKKILLTKNVVLFSFAFLIPLIYLFASNFYGGGTLSDRSEQLTFMNFEKYSMMVDESRRSSIDFQYKEIFFNKFSVFTKVSLQKFFGPYSFEYLFISGDSVVPFGDHGVLYIIDLLFIAIGLIYLIKSKKRNEKTILFLVLALLISGSVGPAISVMGNQFVFRAFLHIPAYILLIILGVRKINIFLILLLYSLFFINFIIFFFFRYSIAQQDNHFISDRVLSNYLSRSSQKNDVNVTVQETDRIFYLYAFYNNIYSNLDEMPEYKEETSIVSNNIVFSKICPLVNDEKTIFILESRSECKNLGENYLVIQNQNDAGVKYKIYNDSICDRNMLTPYRRSHLISDYNIEKMSDQVFCNRWIQNGKTE